MATRIYGASDDLVEVDGEGGGEVGCYGTDDKEQGVLILCSDGTVAEVKYCKRVPAVWGIDVLRKGKLFQKLEPCDDEDADPHSDQLFLEDGIKWVYAATQWEEVH